MSDVKYKAKRSDSVLTPEIRWAYPYVHDQSTTRPNGKPRKTPVWIITGLMPKLHADPTQCANYQFLQRLCMEAVTREIAWGGTFPAGGYWPISDGDIPYKAAAAIPGQPVAPVDPNKGAWRRGCWTFEASTSLAPGPRVCVMQNWQAVEIPSRIVMGRQMYKGGDYGHGSIHAYTFFNEKFGVLFGIEGILWTREGEAIGNSAGPRSATSMFGGVAQVASPTPGQAVGTAAAPSPNVGAAPAPAYAPPPAAPMAPAYAPPMAPAAPAAPVQQAYAPPPMPPAAPVGAGAPGLPPLPR